MLSWKECIAYRVAQLTLAIETARPLPEALHGGRLELRGEHHDRAAIEEF